MWGWGGKGSGRSSAHTGNEAEIVRVREKAATKPGSQLDGWRSQQRGPPPPQLQGGVGISRESEAPLGSPTRLPVAWRVGLVCCTRSCKLSARPNTAACLRAWTNSGRLYPCPKAMTNCQC